MKLFEQIVEKLKADVEPPADEFAIQPGWPSFKRTRSYTRAQAFKLPSEEQRHVNAVSTARLAAQRQAKSEQLMRQPGEAGPKPQQTKHVKQLERERQVAPTEAPQPGRSTWGQQARPSIYPKK